MALSQFSPGVVIREIDNTTVTTVSNPTFGALVGPFAKGPIEQVVTITSELDLDKVFGKPNDLNYEYWFSAAQYLTYGGAIKIVRTDSTSAKNAVSNGTAVKIRNEDDYETNYEYGSTPWYFASRTAGDYGNGVRVYVTDAGPDQILTIDAPTSGNEFQFVVGDAISAASGAAGKVYKYSHKVQLAEGVVGKFAPGVAVIGGDGCTVLAYDELNRVLEVLLDSDYIGIVTPADTVTQSATGASGVVATGTTAVKRELLVVLNKGSISFANGNDILDDNAAECNIGSVQKEYLTREVFPGLKWANIGIRPGTSPSVASKNGFRDELHIVVVDTEGKITGTPNTILEKFVGLSKASDAKTPNGEVNYYKPAIAGKSAYIYIGDHNQADTFQVGAGSSDGDWGQASANVSFDLAQGASVTNPIGGDVLVGSVEGPTVQYVLSGGVSNYTPTNSEYINALTYLSDAESQDIDFFIPGAMGASQSEGLARVAAIVSLVEGRKDCMAFFSPLRELVVGLSDTNQITTNLVNWFSKLPSTSYAAFDTGYKYIYDRYNDTFRYIPCNADMAGLCLSTQVNADPWLSPAGFQRGVLRNAIRLAYSPNKAQRDQLYVERVNPIVAFPGQGIVLFGDKTALGYQSTFDRINVRRLFLTIEKSVARAAQNVLFQQNDDTSRSSFVNVVEPFLRNIQGRRGLTDFLVKCDQSNNPPDAVDRGEFFAEIYLKPTRTINYISISFIATRTGVAFEEVAS